MEVLPDIAGDWHGERDDISRLVNGSIARHSR